MIFLPALSSVLHCSYDKKFILQFTEYANYAEAVEVVAQDAAFGQSFLLAYNASLRSSWSLSVPIEVRLIQNHEGTNNPTHTRRSTLIASFLARFSSIVSCFGRGLPRFTDSSWSVNFQCTRQLTSACVQKYIGMT